MRKLCFIIPYFGEEEEWFKYFFKSFSANIEIDCILISDIQFSIHLPKNITLLNWSIAEFTGYIEHKLDLKIDLSNPYKLCDFKPAYGFIFQEYLKNYSYWGYCDTDIIVGDIDLFLNEPIRLKYDVISPDLNFFPGHFCVLKNAEHVNEIFRRVSNYADILSRKENFYFDEFLIEKGVVITDSTKESHLRKRMSRHKHLSAIKHYLRGFKSIYKIASGIRAKSTVRDFNTAINDLRNRGELEVYMKDMYESDVAFELCKKKIWTVNWNNGTLLSDNRQILYFHFQLHKKSDELSFRETSDEGFELKFR